MAEKKEILKFCTKNGFFLDRSMLNFFISIEKDEFFNIIEKFKLLGLNEKILTDKIFNKYKNKLGFSLDKFTKKNNSFDILRNIDSNFGKIETKDFINYFRSRFNLLKDILIKKNLENLSSIRRVGINNGSFYVIGMIYSKRFTKNKNLLIEIEDLTGRTVVLVNQDNKQLFEQAKQLLLDDVLAFKCSGSGKILFASEFIYPDSCLNSEKFGRKDEFVAFVSDLHVGSSMFLEENFMRFVDWLNGKVGDFRQKNLAKKVKYLVLSGDNIDGIGVYPGQEKFLKIKSCKFQYQKLADILGKIRKDVEIIMCPGQHDAVWIGEPQPVIDKKWSDCLSIIDNLTLVSNPCVVEIDNLKFMIYYGSSLNKFIDEINDIRIKFGHNSPTKVVCEILKRRHLAPVYGLMDIILSKNGDDLVLDDLPDVFVSGGQHKAEVGNYNNILMISGSCWQSKTDFEEKVGNEPDPCKVPILNLKSREVKILDFSDSVEWRERDDLVCDLEDKK